MAKLSPFVVGVLAALGLGLVVAIRKNEAQAIDNATPSGAPPGPNPIPMPGALPSNAYKPVAGSALQGERPPFDHVVILYTSRWAGDHWGQWDGPTVWDGRIVTPADFFHPATWATPEEETLEQLEALGVTNSTPGYWAAYRLQVSYDGAGNAHYGAPGPWTSGRFGSQVNNADGSHVSIILAPDPQHQVEFSARQWA